MTAPQWGTIELPIIIGRQKDVFSVRMQDMVVVQAWNTAHSDFMQLGVVHRQTPQYAGAVENERITLQCPVGRFEQQFVRLQQQLVLATFDRVNPDLAKLAGSELAEGNFHAGIPGWRKGWTSQCLRSRAVKREGGMPDLPLGDLAKAAIQNAPRPLTRPVQFPIPGRLNGHATGGPIASGLPAETGKSKN